MNTPNHTHAVIRELERTLSMIAPEQVEQLVEQIIAAKKILVAGAGRSGLCVKAFAMRLMHMGFDAYVVGETVTPNFEAADLLLIGSGVRRNRQPGANWRGRPGDIGGHIALVTIFPQSTIGQLADIAVRIPGTVTEGQCRRGMDLDSANGLVV